MKLASEQMHSLVRQTCTLWVAAFKELKSDLSTISEKWKVLIKEFIHLNFSESLIFGASSHLMSKLFTLRTVRPYLVSPNAVVRVPWLLLTIICRWAALLDGALFRVMRVKCLANVTPPTDGANVTVCHRAGARCRWASSRCLYLRLKGMFKLTET